MRKPRRVKMSTGSACWKMAGAAARGLGAETGPTCAEDRAVDRPDPKSPRNAMTPRALCGHPALNGKPLELARGRAVDFIIVDSLLPDRRRSTYNAPDRPVPVVYVGVLRTSGMMCGTWWHRRAAARLRSRRGRRGRRPFVVKRSESKWKRT